MAEMSEFLEGRSALVTGAAQGIGAAIATTLARAGASVTIVDRDEGAARALASLIGGRAVVLDLSDSAAVSGFASDGIQADILVNNAGIQHVAALHEFPPEVFKHMHRLMVEAPFLLTRGVLPSMYARNWGRIINISSIHGIRASSYKVAYVAAKHALEGITKVTALEAAPYGVTCNSICPGYVKTGLVERQVADLADAHGENPEDVAERVLLVDSAVKRLLEPEEVAQAVMYLCSAGAESITGSRIVMDGGRAAR